MIQPVITLPHRSDKCAEVERLVDYCRKLDGTEVLVNVIPKEDDAAFIASHPVNTFFSLQAFSLHREALLMKGNSFIHLEPDSIPLKPGWVKILSDAYEAQDRPYLWSSDTHPPGDLVGGIGIYGPNCAKEIPFEFEYGGWDGWMDRNIPEKIFRTPLVQHKYGIYEGIQKTRNISFPRDNSLLRPEAVIFHSDPGQTLMNPRKHLRFAHSGCIGDAIAALSSIRQLGGGELVMTQKFNPRILRGVRYEYLKPLLEAQPYIKSVTWEENPEYLDFDFCDFRTIYKGDVSLAQTQARYMGIHNLDESPWLSVEPDERTRGKIVVSRSPRYQNHPFPWRRFARFYLKSMVFVGFMDEKKALESRIGTLLPMIACKDALEMARLIAGADAFIGNQSSPFWIAAGLGKKLIQETYVPNPDSIVSRPNAFYWRDENDSRGALEFMKYR